MKVSPIQLIRLDFRRVHVDFDQRHAPAEPPNPLTTTFLFDGVSITTEFGIGEPDRSNERGPIFFMSLRVLIDNEQAPDEPGRKFSPYLIDVEASAFVQVLAGAERLGLPEDLASVNGAALLWSAIREQVLNLTARMPVGPVMLPTVHFQDLKLPATPSAVAGVEVVAADKAQAKPAVLTKPKRAKA